MISQEQQQEKQQQPKRVPDGHSQSYGSWPWQKFITQSKNITYFRKADIMFKTTVHME